MKNAYPLCAERWPRWLGTVLLMLIAGLLGCGPDALKEEALDRDFLSRRPLPGDFITNAAGEAHVIQTGPHWMGRVDAGAGLTFAQWRDTDSRQRFSLVVICDPDRDRLVLLPLEGHETPLTVLTAPARRQYYEAQLAALRQEKAATPADNLIVSALSKAIEDKRLGPPLPPPRQLLAVAANFPSHLAEDLAVADAKVIGALRGTRPRVFLKYPPVSPLSGLTPPEEIGGVIGPYDPIRYPRTIHVPTRDENPPAVKVDASVDYETEIGLVIGRRLTWEDVADASDEALYEAIAGYLLVSDTKARNPQVKQNVIRRDDPLPAEPGPYLTGNEAIDRQLGFWDKETCLWWSYAAGWGDYAGLGPFLIAASTEPSLPERMMLSGRSYAPETVRGLPVPPDHAPDTFYLRQSVIVSSRDGYTDRMLWSVPQIIRSVLAPDDNALDFQPGPRTLHPGDIISLGTPGGTVITVKPKAVVDLAGALLFWWEPLDWHDAFFGGNQAGYLHPGDEVFFWAENLGYQQHRIASFDAAR